MKNESIARRLRIRHGISVSALAHAAGISKSRLVFMEGEESPRTEYQRKMLQRAYENLITERRNASDRLEHDYLRVKEHLCEIEDIPDFFEDFNKSAVDESTQWDGHMYMFPLSRTGEVMYYNADFFEEHSLSTPATWEDLRALCAQIHEITGGEALGSDYLDENYVDMVMQMGGSFIDYESKTACFDSEESRATLQYLKDLESNGYLRLKGDDTSLLSPFSAGLIPMVLGSSANYAKIFSQYGAEFNVGVCPIPVMENAEKDYVTMWGVNAVVLKSDKLRQQAAYEFLKFWTSKDYQATWAAGYDAMPVRTSAIETSAYQEYLKTALSTAVIVDGYDRLGFLPAGTGVSDTTNAITACIDEILLGTLSIDDAIVQYKADADAALQQ